MDMKLKSLLEEKRSVLLNRWFDAIIETYPQDMTGFMKKQKDRFANPVGHTINQGIEGIWDTLIEEKDPAEGLLFLEDLIKVRAIQNFTPAQAVAFVFLLKKVVREELEREIRRNELGDALLEFESKIDDLALHAFDNYAKYRERIYNIKTDELKRMTSRLLKKANLASEIPEQEPESGDED